MDACRRNTYMRYYYCLSSSSVVTLFVCVCDRVFQGIAIKHRIISSNDSSPEVEQHRDDLSAGGVTEISAKDGYVILT